MYKKHIKRIFDIFFSCVLIILFLPIFILIAILVKIFLGSPIIFAQERPGLNEKIFILFKFRTMTNKTDENGKLLFDNIRLTKFGALLRKTSLDELPELFNILIGDMSFVGPRPLLKQYLPLYSEKQRRRHLVRPGLTGLAQVNGRNSLDWEEKFCYDMCYVDNISFLIDFKIFLKTIYVVISRKNITATKNETNIYFKGNKN